MAQKKHTPEQIIRKLREVEVALLHGSGRRWNSPFPKR